MPQKLVLIAALALMWTPPLWAQNMVTLASGAASHPDSYDKSTMAASAESAATSALAAAGSAAPAVGGGGPALANSAVGSLAGPAAMTVPGALAATHAIPPPTAKNGPPLWLVNPVLWLVVAVLMLALGIYYWWKSQEKEYEIEEVTEDRNDFDHPWGGREPAVDIDLAFVFDPGPVTAPLGGMSLPRPLSPFSLDFPQTGRKLPLPNGVVTIGSAPDNHIVLEEVEVAPNQAEIYVAGGECDIIVMDAEGRIRLNGRPLTSLRTALKPGDELVIGRTRAFLKKNKPAADQDKYREYQRNAAQNRPVGNRS